MTAPQIHRDYRTVPASLLLETLGNSLDAIKEADKATWNDIGRVLGKSKDRAAAYADGDGDMGVVSFLFGCREWDGRFANDALALVGMQLTPLNGGAGMDGPGSIRALAQLIAAKAAALDDDVIDDDELDAMWPLVEVVDRHIDSLRRRRAERLRRLPDYT